MDLDAGTLKAWVDGQAVVVGTGTGIPPGLVWPVTSAAAGLRDCVEDWLDVRSRQ